MWGSVRDALLAGLDLFLPPACLLCTRPLEVCLTQHSFCRACLDQMPGLSPARCERCAQPYPLPYDTNHLCGRCLTDPPPFVRTHALFAYQDRASDAVHRLKYRHQLSLAVPLGRLLAAVLADAEIRPDLIVPVPLHPARLRDRGYNQALEIARPMARLLDAPIIPRILSRERHTPPQQGLPAPERRQNLRRAFAVNASLDGSSVLLVDDVMTTGETVRACASSLAAVGATKIEVAVLARA